MRNVWLWTIGAVAVAVYVLALAMPAPAIAQAPPCAPFDNVVQQLGEDYGESAIGYGLSTNGAATVVFVNENTGTWSIVILTPDGMGCMPAAGGDWAEPEAFMIHGVDS